MSTPASTLTVAAAWPIERVEAQVAVAVPRELDAIEWAVLAAALAFDGAVDAVEMATALGLGDAVLVDDAADGLVELGALTRDDAGRLAVTRQGADRFGEGRVDGRPAWHGVTLAFDGLTDAVILTPPAATDAPCVAPEALDTPSRQTLDPNQLAQDPAVARLCEDDGRVVDVRVLTARPIQDAVKIDFALADGTLTPQAVTPDGPDRDRLRFVTARGVDPQVLAPLGQAMAFVDATPHDPQPLGPARASGPDPLKTLGAAIATAKHTVVIHPALASVAQVGPALRKAQARGVTVLALAPADTAPQVVSLDGDAPYVRIPARLSAAPAAVVIDGGRALAVATRTLRTAWDGSAVPVRSLDDVDGAPAARVLKALLDALLTRTRPEPREGAPTGLVVAWTLRAVGAEHHRLTSHWAAAVAEPTPDTPAEASTAWAALWPFAPTDAARIDLAWAIAAQADPVSPTWLEGVRRLAPLLAPEHRRCIGQALAKAVTPDHPDFNGAVPVLAALLTPDALAECAHAWCADAPDTELTAWLHPRVPLRDWAKALPAGPLLTRLSHQRGVRAVHQALAIRDALTAVGLDPASVGPALTAALADSPPELPPTALFEHLACPILGPALVEWVWRALPRPAPDDFMEELTLVLDELPPIARAPLAEAAVEAQVGALRALKGGAAWTAILSGWQALGLKKHRLDQLVGKGPRAQKGGRSNQNAKKTRK